MVILYLRKVHPTSSQMQSLYYQKSQVIQNILIQNKSLRTKISTISPKSHMTQRKSKTKMRLLKAPSKKNRNNNINLISHPSIQLKKITRLITLNLILRFLLGQKTIQTLIQMMMSTTIHNPNNQSQRHNNSPTKLVI